MPRWEVVFIARARLLVAVGEVLTAIALAWLAWWCWHRGVIVTGYQGQPLHRIEGRWWAAATAAATLAGILLLDALRESARASTSCPSHTTVSGEHPPSCEPGTAG